jgi:hypothetical protein
MDVAQLSAALYKKTGVALGPGDPAFALVELNRLIFDQAIEKAGDRLEERLNTLPDRIRSSSTALAAEVGSQGAQRVVEMLAESRRTIASDAEQAQRRIAEHTAKLSEPLTRQVAQVARAAQTLARAGTVRAGWLLATAAIGLASCTCGFMSGQVAAAHGLLWLSLGR